MTTSSRRIRPAAAAQRGEASRPAPAATAVTSRRSRTAKVEQGRMVSHSGYGRKDDQTEASMTEVVSTREFAPLQEPAFVRVAVGQTYNLGNYESLRLDVSVTLPCLPDELEQTYVEASEFAADKLGEEEAAWLGSRAKKSASRKGGR